MSPQAEFRLRSALDTRDWPIERCWFSFYPRFAIAAGNRCSEATLSHSSGVIKGTFLFLKSSRDLLVQALGFGTSDRRDRTQLA
ncbi:MAG: hypothetical protein AAGG53_03725 [Cyanobacteria bacterium P01_H01_bin.152]